jgi:hypothetical protein
MSTSSESLVLLSRAAELRASGTRWPDAATQLSVGHDELRKLVAEHNRDYERLARRARADLLRETLDEAVAALRVMLKSPDARLGFLAATTLVRFELARMRHGMQAARERLERDTSARGRRRLTAEAKTLDELDTSESTEVKTSQHLAAPKNVAQSTTQATPSAAARVTPAAPMASVTPPAPVEPAAQVATHATITPHERERRKRLLLHHFVTGAAEPPLWKDDRLDEEVSRIADGLLADPKVDDAPPG